MFLAIPLMAICLYGRPSLIPWYISYVVLFNMLVGPVFSAGSVTSERERQTLDLLLTTILSPGQILRGKLISGLRVSSVLTSFLLWPLLLACFMVPIYGIWSSDDRVNLLSVGMYVAIVGLCCVTTATVALFCSVLFRKTAHSLMATYLLIIVLFCAPLAMRFFVETFFPQAAATAWISRLSVTSPLAAIFAVPFYIGNPTDVADRVADWWQYGAYVGFTLVWICVLVALIGWLFRTRWRVAE
ncbi:MAG TPA: ABC transporter permease subunit, partial [Pirellulales bacterium]